VFESPSHQQFRSRTTLAWGLLAIVLLAGCGSETETRGRPLVGTWVLEDGDDVARRTTSADSTTEAPSESRMQLDFASGGRLETRTNINAIDSRKAGTWQAIAYNESSKVMDIECNLDGQKSDCEVEFLSADRIKLNPPNMSGLNLKLTFKRK
jgi:hypothetical protein